MNPEPASDAIVVDHFPAARRSLRISVVTETYPPEVNGVASTIARVVQGLQQRNHEVQLVRPRQPASPTSPITEPQPGIHEVLMRGLPVPRYPNLRMGVPSKRQLVQLWSHQRPDVVHIATEGPLGWSALQAALHLKLPVTSDFRTNFHAYSQHYGVGWLRKPIMVYLRKFHNRCAATMVPTEALRQELQAAGFRQLVTLARGVDTRIYQPSRRSEALRQRWGVRPDDLVVACVGRLAPEKNLGLVLDSFAAIVQRVPRARLLLVGDGPQRAELLRRMPEAILAGQRHGEDLAAHYASADLFLFASLTETFGNVTTEAMASGLPVVAFNYAAAAQMIDSGQNGRLVPCGDAAGFIAAAVAVATQPERLPHLGRSARERALAQDWDGIVARFETVLLQALRVNPAPQAGGLVRPRAA